MMMKEKKRQRQKESGEREKMASWEQGMNNLHQLHS